MKQIVTSGEQDCTVQLNGTECAVVFSSNYRCFTVLNDTAGDIYISISPNITAGKDGVRRVASGASSSLAHGRNNIDTLYILGTGSVQVTASDSPGNFFKSAPVQSGGGSGTGDGYTKSESDERYAQKSEIPTALPANGGNADTAENINGVIIFKSLNMGVAEVGSAVKRVCNANTVPKTTGFVYAGIWFKNTLDTAVTAAVAVYVTAKSPVIQAGYGTGSLQSMYGSGSGREWFANTTLDTSVVAVKMTVPAGKTGYFAFNMTSADVYAVIEDAAVFTDRFI